MSARKRTQLTWIAGDNSESFATQSIQPTSCATPQQPNLGALKAARQIGTLSSAYHDRPATYEWPSRHETSWHCPIAFPQPDWHLVGNHDILQLLLPTCLQTDCLLIYLQPHLSNLCATTLPSGNLSASLSETTLSSTFPGWQPTAPR